MNDKKIAIWGTGNICRSCLRLHKDTNPSIFIDSNKKEDVLGGVPILYPKDVKDWKEYFVIIAVMSYAPIVCELEKMGLHHQTDYTTYIEYWGEAYTIEDSLAKMEKWIVENPQYKHSRVIQAPIFTSRQASMMQNFFGNYIKSRYPEQCIVLSNLGVVGEAEASEKLQTPVFGLPNLYCFDSPDGNIDKAYEEARRYQGCEDAIDCGWLEYLEKIKKHKDPHKEKVISNALYYYIKRLFEILEPKNVLIWGSWDRFSLMLEHVSQKNNIFYGFLEYGSLPGTIQFDKGGFAGRSEYAQHQPCIPDLESSKEKEFEKIKKFILSKRVDTGIFCNTDCDSVQMQKIDPTKKTILFVGMGDDGIHINGQSDFWKDYLSETVASTAEAVDFLYNLCRKQDWNFVFKPHPREYDEATYAGMENRPDFVFIRDRQIDDLVEAADVVISIASAVDYKVLLHEKPLVHIGHNTMQKVKCDYYAASLQDVQENVQLALKYSMTDEQKRNYRNFIMWLLETHYWDDLQEKELHYGLTCLVDFFDGF